MESDKTTDIQETRLTINYRKKKDYYYGNHVKEYEKNMKTKTSL